MTVFPFISTLETSRDRVAFNSIIGLSSLEVAELLSVFFFSYNDEFCNDLVAGISERATIG